MNNINYGLRFCHINPKASFRVHTGKCHASLWSRREFGEKVYTKYTVKNRKSFDVLHEKTAFELLTVFCEIFLQFKQFFLFNLMDKPFNLDSNANKSAFQLICIYFVKALITTCTNYCNVHILNGQVIWHVQKIRWRIHYSVRGGKFNCSVEIISFTPSNEFNWYYANVSAEM